MQQAIRRPVLAGDLRLPDIAGLGGATAGLAGGLTMIGLSPILSWLSGIGIWDPPTYIAATVLGSAVLGQSGLQLGPVLLGTLIHMVASVVLGVIFGIVYHRVLHLTTDFGLPLYVGLIYGLLIFMIAYFVILPVVAPQLIALSAGMAPLLMQNLVFALCVGLFYTLVRPTPYRDTRRSS